MSLECCTAAIRCVNCCATWATRSRKRALRRIIWMRPSGTKPCCCLAMKPVSRQRPPKVTFVDGAYLGPFIAVPFFDELCPTLRAALFRRPFCLGRAHKPPDQKGRHDTENDNSASMRLLLFEESWVRQFSIIITQNFPCTTGTENTFHPSRNSLYFCNSVYSGAQKLDTQFIVRAVFSNRISPFDIGQALNRLAGR